MPPWLCRFPRPSLLSRLAASCHFLSRASLYRARRIEFRVTVLRPFSVRIRRHHHVKTLHWVSRPIAAVDGPRLMLHSGLAWHTDDQALRQKFEEFGQVEEAVS